MNVMNTFKAVTDKRFSIVRDIIDNEETFSREYTGFVLSDYSMDIIFFHAVDAGLEALCIGVPTVDKAVSFESRVMVVKNV